MPRTTSPARISRRTVAAGAAWATPVVAVAAAAPALASSCATGPSDIYFGYKWVCGGLNSDTCEYVIQMNSLTTCGTGGIPSGTKVTITMTNTSPNADTVTVNSTGTTWKVDSASGSGVVTPTQSGSAAGTVGAGVTWTYNLSTTTALPAGTGPSWRVTRLDPNLTSPAIAHSWNITATLVTDPGPDTTNSTSCSANFTPLKSLFYPSPNGSFDVCPW